MGGQRKKSLLRSNSILPFLKFTGEFSFKKEAIPCLDTELWIGRSKTEGPWFEDNGKEKEVVPGGRKADEHWGVLYRFYKKPRAARQKQPPDPLRID